MDITLSLQYDLQTLLPNDHIIYCYRIRGTNTYNIISIQSIISSSQTIIGQGFDKILLDIFQKYNKQGFNIRLLEQGIKCGARQPRSQTIHVLNYGTISKILQPVHYNISMFKQICDAPFFLDLEDYFVAGKICVNDIPICRNRMLITQNSTIVDFSEIDIDLLLQFFYEDATLVKIVEDFNQSRSRNKFIDQLIEAGYEEWL